MLDFYSVGAAHAVRFFSAYFTQYEEYVPEVILGPDLPSDLCINVVSGTQAGDIIYAAFPVFSKRFVDVLRDCQATGYRACAIRVERKGELIPDYFLLKLTGRGGPLDEQRSEFVRDPSGAFLSREAVYMDESKWDGSDVFAIPGMDIAMYVVERIADALSSAELRNVQLVLNSEDSFEI